MPKLPNRIRGSTCRWGPVINPNAVWLWPPEQRKSDAPLASSSGGYRPKKLREYRNDRLEIEDLRIGNSQPSIDDFGLMAASNR